jgi:hypothetical protein
MAIELINSGESGIAVRNTLNELINLINSSSLFGVLVHPQVITTDITIPAAYNGLLLTPISISGSITVGESSNLTIM